MFMINKPCLRINILHHVQAYFTILCGNLNTLCRHKSFRNALSTTEILLQFPFCNINPSAISIPQRPFYRDLYAFIFLQLWVVGCGYAFQLFRNRLLQIPFAINLLQWSFHDYLSAIADYGYAFHRF